MLFCVVLISIHAPAWGATGTAVFVSADGEISIHAPAWGATIISSVDHGADVFQSTLPHGERRTADIRHRGEFPISIHAPAWGATPALLADAKNR